MSDEPPVLGHRFHDPELLRRGGTHASAIDDQADAATRLAAANERLEFLGDALLGAAVAELLYRRHGAASEGALTRHRSRLVNRRHLAVAFDRHGLAERCRIGAQMLRPWPVSVKANLVEGILGAIHLDGGWSALLAAVAELLGADLDELAAEAPADWKSRLQELALARTGSLPVYRSERIGGSDHDPLFTSEVQVGEARSRAEAGSRRGAETLAARQLVRALESSG